MQRSLAIAFVLLLASSPVAFPVRSETFQSNTPPFAIDYPKGWKIRDGEGGIATRAVGPGSAMNVSVAAASRPDFDADRFSDADLDRIAGELAAATAGALEEFELLETGRAKLGGKPAAFFRYRAVVQQAKGPIQTVGVYYATAHRGLVYSVTGVTQARLARDTHPAIIDAIQSFRFLDAGAPAEGERP
jgi:hypothetical protein